MNTLKKSNSPSKPNGETALGWDYVITREPCASCGRQTRWRWDSGVKYGTIPICNRCGSWSVEAVLKQVEARIAEKRTKSKPKRKRKPFARWMASMNQLFYRGSCVGVMLFPRGITTADQVASALNKHRVTLKVRP